MSTRTYNNISLAFVMALGFGINGFIQFPEPALNMPFWLAVLLTCCGVAGVYFLRRVRRASS